MPKRPLKNLFSILAMCTLLTVMLALSPTETAQASDISNILFKQTPTVSTDATTNAYTSTSVVLGDVNVPY